MCRRGKKSMVFSPSKSAPTCPWGGITRLVVFPDASVTLALTAKSKPFANWTDGGPLLLHAGIPALKEPDERNITLGAWRLRSSTVRAAPFMGGHPYHTAPSARTTHPEPASAPATPLYCGGSAGLAQAVWSGTELSTRPRHRGAHDIREDRAGGYGEP